MCCLFGMLDYGQTLNRHNKERIINVLARESEIRGRDATGISYAVQGKIRIYKRPQPAHKLYFSVGKDTAVVMGHTRLATQGDRKKNINNHPFAGIAGNTGFALAHNGVLYNDEIIRIQNFLPVTSIETDSYVAAQLLEKSDDINFKSLQNMAETVTGSFVFTVHTDRDELYFVRGENPLCIYDLPDIGIYIYASTEEVLKNTLNKLRMQKQQRIRIFPNCGDIIRIDRNGKLSKSGFMYEPLWNYTWNSFENDYTAHSQEDDYTELLKANASFFGISSKDIDVLLDFRYSPEEIEEMLYDPDELKACISYLSQYS